MNLCPPIVFKWFDDNNAPAQGWKLYTYIAGSSTPVDTFTDSSGATQNTNPIILDARGEARLWLDPSVSYKLVVTTPTGDPLSPEFVQDDVTNAGSSVSGLSRVYYSDSSTIAFSGLGTLATPLSAQIKLSTYPNNALQIRPDGLYAMAIGGGGSVAWGSITGSINAQSDLIAKFGEYLPLTFATPQVLNMTGASGSTFVFANAGQFVSQSAIDNSYLSLHPNSQKIIWQASNGTQSDLVFPSAPASPYVWTLPNASGTIALTSDIPSVPVLSVFGRTGAVTAQVGDYSAFYQPLDSDLTAIAGLTANGLLRKTAGVWGMDSASYLTGNQTITLSGEVTGSGATAITTTLSNSAVIGKVLTGFSATNSAIVATDTILQGFNKAQGQINALVTADGTFIKRDGTSTTTATIPFAVGLSVTGTMAGGEAMRIPDGSWIRPQTAGQALYLTRGANPSVINGVLHLDTSSSILTYGDGAQVRSRLDLGAGVVNLQAYNVSGVLLDFLSLGNNAIDLRCDNSNGFSANASGSQIVGALQLSSTLQIGSIPTGTQVGLLAYDASGNIIQGSASGGATWGSITGTLSAQTDLQTALNGKINLAGHNDLTTPWSVGDASTWGTSSAGVQVDPVGAYGLYLKGNAIIEQAVSQALTLYRPVTSGDICLNYDAQDSLGVQSSYAQVCGVVVSNTAGSVGGGLDLEVAIAGVMTPLLQLRQAGSTLSSALSVSGAGCSVNTNTSDQGYIATSSAFTNGGLFLGRSSRGTIASPTALQSGDTLVFLGGQGYGATGYSSLSRAVIRFHTSETWTDTAQGTYISFSTTPNGSTTRAERGRIENDGVLTWLNRIDTPASTTASAGLRLPHGTAPSSPTNGDVWSTTSGLFYRINGATKTSADLETAQTFASVKTFSSTPVISSTTASTTAGALYRINNGGLANYEHGMVRLTQATLYRAPVGTALTNSVTETDVNGGTAVIGTRTMSTSAFQISAFVRVRARVKYTNTAANTLTIRLRWNTISGTILGSVTLTRVNAGAEVFDVDFVGVAQAVPGASVATSWAASVFGNSLIVTNATSAGSEATLATSTATPLILSAQWTSALATSSVQILNSQITLE
jgi:hypothetical protein